MFICENCGKQFEMGYGKRNRFCTRSCCASYSAKKSWVNPTEKRITHLQSMRNSRKSKNSKKSKSFLEKEEKEGTCRFCGRICKNLNSLRCHERLCKENPNHQESHLKEYNLNKVGKKRVGIYENCNCKFCQKPFLNKCAKSFHERFCFKNPNKEIKPVSEEAKKKIGEASRKRGAGGYEVGKLGGKGKRGYYKGLYCMSSWELAFVYYYLEHGSIVEQCKEHFPYEMNGKKHLYTPDFIVDGIYYEIKNWHRPDTDFKIAAFPKDKKLILIEGSQNNVYLNFVKEKWGNNFWEHLYNLPN